MKNKISLFIDTSKTQELVLGLVKDGKKNIKLFHIEKEHLSQKLLLFIDKLLKKDNLSVHDLTNIIVYCGPGSYTSLRIGISCANSLAWGLNIPIYSIRQNEDVDEAIVKMEKSRKKTFSQPAKAYYQQPIL